MTDRGFSNEEWEAAPRIDMLASSVSDGAEIDWALLEREFPDPDRFVLRNLRAVARIGRVHRTLRESAGREEGGRGIGAAGSAAGAGAPSPDASLHRWGSLEIRARIGGGAYGEVLRAYDPHLEREVALKLLRASDTGQRGRGSVAIEEGRLLAKLRHPNVVTVFGAEEHEGRVGVWMELLEGRTLEAELLSRGAFSATEAASVGVELCRALAAVHAAGLIHRDVKAQNVVREEGGRIVLMDLGSGIEEESLRRENRNWSILGTPLYMAPEVLRGEPATTRSDLYSLGVLLWHLVTRDYPVRGSSLVDLLESHASRVPGTLRDRRPDLPEPFVRVVERALAPDPEKRFGSAGEMAAALADAVPAVPSSSPSGRIPGSEGSRAERGAGATEGRATGAGRAPRPVPHRARSWIMAGAAAVVLAGAAAWYLAPQGASEGSLEGAASDLRATATGVAAATGEVTGVPFRIAARLFRQDPVAGPVPLSSGDVVYRGDRIWMSYEASAPLHVHLLARDSSGATFCLFSTSESEDGAPLAAGETLHLPRAAGGGGSDRSGPDAWVMDDVPGRETLLLIAGVERDRALESFLAAVPRPPYEERGETTRGVSRVEPIPADERDRGENLSLEAIRSFATRRLDAREARGVFLEEIVLDHRETERPSATGPSRDD